MSRWIAVDSCHNTARRRFVHIRGLVSSLTDKAHAQRTPSFRESEIVQRRELGAQCVPQRDIAFFI